MDPGSHRPLRVGVTSTHCVGRRFCTFPLSRDVLLAPSRLSREDVAASHSPCQQKPTALRGINNSHVAAGSPAAKEHTMAVLTLSGNKSDFARRARLHREQTLLAAAKCGDRAAFDELFQPLANGTLQIAYRITRNREDAED